MYIILYVKCQSEKLTPKLLLKECACASLQIQLTAEHIYVYIYIYFIKKEEIKINFDACYIELELLPDEPNIRDMNQWIIYIRQRKLRGNLIAPSPLPVDANPLSYGMRLLLYFTLFIVLSIIFIYLHI